MSKKMIKNNMNGHSDPVHPLIKYAMASNNRFVLNDSTFLSRAALLSLTGKLPELDIDQECRYPDQITPQDYQKMYDRMGIASRIVSIYPEETWQMPPEIYETESLADETEFEKAWSDLNESMSILSQLETVDEVSGIGQFGILLLGFNDGLEMDQPVRGFTKDGVRDGRFKDLSLLYVRPLPQAAVVTLEFELDKTNPRYGQPTYYNISLVDPQMALTATAMPPPAPQTKVHWTRVLHVADNRKSSSVLGTPRMQNVYNDLLDIKKILGANGQGYWSSGFPGLSIETQPGIEAVDFDKDATKQELLKYFQGLQRWLALEGLQAKSLSPNISDPKSHLDSHLLAICLAKGIPFRVFQGSEEGKLASSQDQRTWNKRLARRQVQYVNPFILRAFFERMFICGVLPRPQKLVISWPDLNAPTENDRATTCQKITDALVKYITGNVFLLMGPKEYLTLIVGLPNARVEAVIAANPGMKAAFDKLAKLAVTAPPPVSSNPSAATQKPSTRARGPKKQPAGE